jgi:rsbT co-antagonist protein RsbR
MSDKTTGFLSEIIENNRDSLLNGWLEKMLARLERRDRVAAAEFRSQADQFLSVMASSLRKGGDYDINGAAWSDLRALLSDISRVRLRQGFTPNETALFVFSLKEPLFQLLTTALASDPVQLAHETMQTSVLFDNLGLYTLDEFQKGREQVIMRQQQELLELSTPVVTLWKNVLALPLIGTLDSARTQVVMESLLQKIIETGAAIAIIDITGVPTVDTLVAQHLLKTVAAARLMGADCIISGIRPQIAQTIVHLGVNLEGVITKATLADAFQIALERSGASIIVA